MDKFEFKIEKHITTLSEHKSYTKELNLVSFRDEEAVYDLRRWQNSEEGEPKMLKGITLSRDELIKLRDVLNSIEI